ncbi:MAG: type II secretion system protein M [Pseudomonadales bacterium]|jgi:general secretion pathway protein M|nr:type II secretion system protein M [Pseudomonadales bacterium]
MPVLGQLGERLATGFAATPAGQWYRGQAPRDQRLLVLLAAFLLIVAVYLAVWVPIQDGLTVARSRHADALADQRWMIANRDVARRAAGRSSAGAGRSGQALLSVVANSARRAELTLNRFQPEGGDALAVSLDDVAFGDLVAWLETLAREEGIEVRQASVDARDAPGRVRARLVLN